MPPIDWLSLGTGSLVALVAYPFALLSLNAYLKRSNWKFLLVMVLLILITTGGICMMLFGSNLVPVPVVIPSWI